APRVTEALIDNPGGIRDWLDDHGLTVKFDNVNEFAGIISGGRSGPSYGGSSNAGQYGLGIDADMERLAGLTGLSLHTIFVGRYGTPISNNIPDGLNPSQEIYGAGGNVVVHHVMTYAEQTLLDNKLDIALGWLPVANDFAASPLNCTFMNNSICGNPKTLFGTNAFSSYPDGVWGGRVRYEPVPEFYGQAGVYAYNNGLYTNKYYRTGFEFNSSQISGIVIPVELGWRPEFFAGDPDRRLPGHYKIGAAPTPNGQVTDTFYDVNGQPAALTGLPFRKVRGTYNLWVTADQMVHRYGPGPQDGMILLAYYTHQDGSVAIRQDQFTAGIINRGFWRERPQDSINAMFSYTKVSSDVIKFQNLQAIQDPFFRDFQNHTFNIEFNYNIHLFPGVDFQPDFQYYINPNAQKNIPDAALLGFKTHIEFF
ncbi:MAG: carbohydrate porin, partial [Acetobacteraceae bacterium]|nr:carbohydrate porin [Acetobacteraceae bacterium]